jgi:hypothetical protein
MATKRLKPSTALAQLHQRLDRVTGDGTCVALILPLIGLAMRCTRPCARCRALAAEVERLRPEWDRARDEDRCANAELEQPPSQEQQGRGYRTTSSRGTPNSPSKPQSTMCEVPASS